MLRQLKKMLLALGSLHSGEEGQTFAEDALFLTFVVGASVAILTLAAMVASLVTFG